MEKQKVENYRANQKTGRRPSYNLALPAGGIRRPHPRPDIGGTRVRQCLVVRRHMSPQTPPIK